MKSCCCWLLLLGLWLPGGPARAQAAAPGRASKFLAQVGDIAFDPRTDRADFALCDSGRIYQYYQVQTVLEGEHRAVLDYFGGITSRSRRPRRRAKRAGSLSASW